MADGSQSAKEAFEQAIAATARAVAQDRELEVKFTADVPGLAAGEARVKGQIAAEAEILFAETE